MSRPVVRVTPTVPGPAMICLCNPLEVLEMPDQMCYDTYKQASPHTQMLIHDETT